MNKIFLVVSLFSLCSCMSHKKTKVIFFGDSITELGKMPGGFITDIDTLVKTQHLSDKFEFIGSGDGGNQVYDLYLRMDDDVLSQNPNVVVIYIGVNDVWHKRLMGTGTEPDKFERFFQAIINKMRTRNIKTVLCTPGVIGEKADFGNAQDSDLNRYSDIVRTLAQKNKLPLVDLRQKFHDYDEQYNKGNSDSGILTSNMVHLNARGNKLVADEMWKVIKGI